MLIVVNIFGFFLEKLDRKVLLASKKTLILKILTDTLFKERVAAFRERPRTQ